MKKNILISFITISIFSCSKSEEKTIESNIVGQTINKITTPKLFVEGEWVLKDDLYIDSYKKPYYTIEAINDSSLLFKINAYQGGQKFKYTEVTAKINQKSDTLITATDNENSSIKYNFTIKNDNILIMGTKLGNEYYYSKFLIPF